MCELLHSEMLMCANGNITCGEWDQHVVKLNEDVYNGANQTNSLGLVLILINETHRLG